MKHYQMHLRYITAILLLTLSSHVNAAQCNEQEWNQALISQQALDKKYNLIADKYNRWLPTFHNSVFLHKEFSHQELNYLWHKDSDKFRYKVTQQIETAILAKQTISELIDNIAGIPPVINQQLKTWQDIQYACQQQNSITNEIAADHYITSDIALQKDLSNLVQQLKIMQSYYNNEVLILEAINKPAS